MDGTRRNGFEGFGEDIVEQQFAPGDFIFVESFHLWDILGQQRREGGKTMEKGWAASAAWRWALDGGGEVPHFQLVHLVLSVLTDER